MILAFLGKWNWAAIYVISLVVIHLGASAFLDARVRIEFADPADARQDKPGRWYPE